jgi:UDP-glucuronate 4-epimerase
MKVLVTGSAGFIGFHLVEHLVRDQHEVVGLDCINDYYDPNLKYARLAVAGISRKALLQEQALVPSTRYGNYRFIKADLSDKDTLLKLFKENNFDVVVNLAAQAGVRYSLENPSAYVDANITGFLNILEACRAVPCKHLVYASSSSVYGLNKHMPFSCANPTDQPISLYAASKKSNELMAHTYSYLFGIPSTGLRFFTVYGPWGRPDMALFKFTKAILEEKAIDIYNHGEMARDFTFIDDIIEGVMAVIKNQAPSSPHPYQVFNIGYSQPVALMDFVTAIEECLGKKAIKNFLGMQSGDVVKTWAEMDDFCRKYDYRPQTSVADGVAKFISWYKSYYC